MFARLELTCQTDRIAKIKQHDTRRLQVHDGTLIVRNKGKIIFLDDGLQSLREPIPCTACNHRRVGPFHFEQRIISRHTRKRIGRKCPADISPLTRATDASCEAHDHIRASAHAARHGVAAADAFAEYRQIRLDAEEALGSTHAQAEACHNLVEDQEGTELVTELAYLLIEIK